MTSSTCLKCVQLIIMVITMHGNYNAENNVQHVTTIVKFKRGTFVIF